MQRNRMGMIAAIGFAALLATTALVAGEAEDEQEAQVAHGRELYLDNCATCHGMGGRGDGPMADDLKVPPADLTQIAARRGGAFNGAEMREVVDGRKAVESHGSRDMPVWGHEFAKKRKKGEGREAAARNRTRALVEYLESIQR
jgi:mono/diheme cytochrome c family protein